MLRVSRGMAPGVMREDEHAGIWIWSDLHLGHTETLHAFGRPFETAAGMDDKIFWNWRRVVAPEDTILILGDVTVHPLWGRRLKRVRQAPGRKILVYGNHEITRAGSVDNDGFDEVYSTLYVDGDPPLLLTHVPLRVVPEGCVNVHGHLHQRPGAGRDATYQRLRRAAPLPAQGPDGGPGARPATRHRRHRERPHDGPPAGSGALTDLFRPAAGPRASASSPPTTRTLELARAGAAEGCRCSPCTELSLMTSSVDLFLKHPVAPVDRVYRRPRACPHGRDAAQLRERPLLGPTSPTWPTATGSVSPSAVGRPIRMTRRRTCGSCRRLASAPRTLRATTSPELKRTPPSAARAARSSSSPPRSASSG